MAPPNRTGPSRWACTVALLLVALVPLGCGSLQYDLSSLTIPVSAKPAPPGTPDVEPFEIHAKSYLWVHGLLGHSAPDVAALVAEQAEGSASIAGFRAKQGASFHDWLFTHLTLTLVRFKTVTIEGQLVGRRPR